MSCRACIVKPRTPSVRHYSPALRSCAFLIAVLAFLAGVATNAGESVALPPSEPSGAIAEGTPAATPYYVQDSGRDGPTVMILGGAHGDEPAGAYAADQLRHWPIVRGRLIVVPRQNRVALAAAKRATPGTDAALANLNRDFPKPGEPATARGLLAEAIWKLAQAQKPTWLLDLHEGADFGVNGSVGSSIIACAEPAAREMAVLMLAALNDTIGDPARKFTLRSPPIAGSLARAAGEHLGAHTMILETTLRNQALSLRARQHRILVHAFLNKLEMLDAGVTPEWLTDHAAAKQLNVALYDAEGTGGNGVPRVSELLGVIKDVAVVQVGPEDVRRGALDQFQVIMCTGGGASRQGAAIGQEGRARIRTFVEGGGGYVGICAGAYLACSGFSWGLDILNAKTVSSKWKRGMGSVKIELTETGRGLLGDLPGELDIRYANGPIIAPDDSKSLAPYETLAFFRTELAENDAPPGVMVNSPAIVAGRCGKGRVVCFSPHPEQSKALEAFVWRAVAWTQRREP